MSNQILNLIAQLDRLQKHNRIGSIQTRVRYYEAMQRFCRWLADTYHVERLANIAPKHIIAYTRYLQARGVAPSTIKTDLSAIRFYHDLMPSPRYDLPTNRDLALQRRSYLGVDRSWSDQEFTKMILYTDVLGRDDYMTCLYLARYAALRIHECFRIDTAIANKAIRDHAITIKGKGGLVRTVPLVPMLEARLRYHLASTPRGHKLFVPDDVPTHKAIHGLQKYIETHRLFAKDPDSDRPMTFHGLRHTCASEWYDARLAAGDTPKQARLAVARLLGHGRDDVTKIYLAKSMD